MYQSSLASNFYYIPLIVSLIQNKVVNDSWNSSLSGNYLYHLITVLLEVRYCKTKWRYSWEPKTFHIYHISRKTVCQAVLNLFPHIPNQNVDHFPEVVLGIWLFLQCMSQAAEEQGWWFALHFWISCEIMICINHFSCYERHRVVLHLSNCI